jgi:hypothetical protein
MIIIINAGNHRECFSRSSEVNILIIIIIIMVKINKEAPDERFRGLARGYY